VTLVVVKHDLQQQPRRKEGRKEGGKNRGSGGVGGGGGRSTYRHKRQKRRLIRHEQCDKEETKLGIIRGKTIPWGPSIPSPQVFSFGG